MYKRLTHQQQLSVSTWVWLCISVNTYMTLHFTVCIKHHQTEKTQLPDLTMTGDILL